MKICTRCGVSKAETEFYLDKRWNRLRSRCKTCAPLRANGTRSQSGEIPSRKRARQRYEQTEKGRAVRRAVELRRYSAKSALNAHHTEREWLTLCKTVGWRCVHCLKDLPLERDHIIPLSKGGGDLIDNIQPLCRSCNARKGNKCEVPI